MHVHRGASRLTIVIASLAAWGCSSSGTFPDAGPVVPGDATAARDATVVRDVGPARDALPGEDAIVAPDAVPGEDALPGQDAIIAPDADPFADALPPMDAEPARDADEPGRDADEPGLDALPSPDAIVAADAPPGADTPPVVTPDAGFAPDAVVVADAGIGLDCSRRPGINPNAGMTFFATSVGTGAAGGDLGGLAGADARCACLAATVGATGRTWRAYLSQASPLVNARDRIGAGPWLNFNGASIGNNAAIHGAGGIDGNLIRTEDGQAVPEAEHDMLTGSDPNGTPHQNYDCGGWQDGTNTGFAWVGHPDWNLPNGSGTWNAAHESFCSPAGLAANGGSGRIYCFAQ